jgi:hypothetical protein
MVQATSARQLSISIAYSHKAPHIALFMDYSRIADVDTLAEITIAWASANLREGERVSSYIGTLANLAGGDIRYVDISHELEDNSWYRYLNGLNLGSFGNDDGYPLHFEPCKAVSTEESGEMSPEDPAEGISK